MAFAIAMSALSVIQRTRLSANKNQTECPACFSTLLIEDRKWALQPGGSHIPQATCAVANKGRHFKNKMNEMGGHDISIFSIW